MDVAHRVDLWEAINTYARACGADTSEPHHGLRPPAGNETGAAIARGAVVA
jgi:hypothetical protein